MLNSMADILSINWIAKCEKIPLIFVNELAQCIFINPIHDFLLGIDNLINIPNNLMKNRNTGMCNGISIEDAKIMIKCNYLGKKIDFSPSIIDLLNNSSSLANWIKNTIIMRKMMMKNQKITIKKETN